MLNRCAQIAAVGVAAPLAHAQSTSYYEFSEDAHAFAVTIDEPASAHRGIGVPFGSTPDLQVVLRRQVGGLQIAEFTGDGSINFFDVSAFLSAYNAMSPAADFTGDGVFNFFDVSAFLNAFNAGCP